MNASFSSRTLSPYEQENSCALSFSNGGPFWHICTDGQSMEIICKSDEDFRFAMNVIAVASAITGVRIIAFQIMSNHIHVIAEGSKTLCAEFFEEVRRRLRRYHLSLGDNVNFDAFEAEILPVENLQALRVEICYVHRNGYLVNKAFTPFSYPWGSGYVYFNASPHTKVARLFSSLSRNEKRNICRSRIPELPEYYTVDEGILLPESFCAVKYGQSMFRDAQQYFSMVSKNFEAYSAVAKKLKDRVFLTDYEMNSVVLIVAKKMFGEQKPTMLPVSSKIELAKVLRREYNASEGQLQRLLRLDRSVVRELFGSSPF